MSHKFARRTYGRSRAVPINVPSATTDRKNRTLSEPAATQAVPLPPPPTLPPPSRSSSWTSTSVSTSSSSSSSTTSLPHRASVPASSLSSSQATSGLLPSTISRPPPGRYSLRSESGPASSAETSLSTSDSVIDLYSGYGGFFCCSFEVTGDEFAYFTQARKRGLPLPRGQTYEDRVEELVQTARFQQVEMDFAEGKIQEEERKMESMAVSTKGGRGSGSGSGSGSGGRRGISGKAGRVSGLARDSDAAASGSASSSHSSGARPGRR
ncbi:hypothetical protein EPUS_03844 [Endocarpon pusillum Z07020]|uniref:Uncharacterized protein n=1 Tax=Endocarpon pusillum (strain Z07020 / HMAS-L-300199) TaxID=1263415 RepID=U1HX76_ENDPU|nr:uncharacterized protein EPUS_03844 [Endocarpon pusillum Z07020]ERF74029.1 hypothetical protein EPUS_03844 [Endocarpon pusillum Z07020]